MLYDEFILPAIQLPLHEKYAVQFLKSLKNLKNTSNFTSHDISQVKKKCQRPGHENMYELHLPNLNFSILRETYLLIIIDLQLCYRKISLHLDHVLRDVFPPQLIKLTSSAVNLNLSSIQFHAMYKYYLNDEREKLRSDKPSHSLVLYSCPDNADHFIDPSICTNIKTMQIKSKTKKNYLRWFCLTNDLLFHDVNYFTVILPKPTHTKNFVLTYKSGARGVVQKSLVVFDFIWLKTRNEELYTEEQIDALGGYILPIPPLWNFYEMEIYCGEEKEKEEKTINPKHHQNQNNELLQDFLVVKFCHRASDHGQPTTPLAIPRKNTGGINLELFHLSSFSSLLNPTKPKLVVDIQCQMLRYYQNQLYSSLVVFDRSYDVLCKWWIVVCYEDLPYHYIPDHVFTEVSVSYKDLYMQERDTILQEGDGYYFHYVVPTLFGENPAKKYMVYQCIFHKTPPILPYSLDSMQTAMSDYLTPQSTHHSTFNHHHTTKIKFRVCWDHEVVQRYFPNPNDLSLRIYSETCKPLIYEHGQFFPTYTYVINNNS
jgi:hypothetical protein